MHDLYLDKALQLLAVKRKQQEIDQRKEEMSAPLKELREQVKSLFGPVLEQLETAEKELKEQLVSHLNARMLESAQRSNEAMAAGDMDLMLKEMTIVPDVPGIQYSTIRGFDADETQVPEEYFTKTLDKKKVLAALKAGKNIPGVKPTQQTQIRVTLVTGDENG